MGILKLTTVFINIRRCFYENPKKTVMKYLNVAEKNDAAKNIASILSRGASNRREGLSPFNKIYEFNTNVFNHPALMVMTSVSGHLLNYEFHGIYKNWQSVNPLTLFDAPIYKTCPENYIKIKKTLEREIVSCNGLIIWTDCDREGENIGFEIINVCQEINPNIQIYRAKFSEITAASVFRALNNLAEPNRNISDAVDVRQELDLRTGAAFTRLQTLRLQKVFPQKLADRLISYGSCQFPTLGFVVERYKAIEDFISEPFWRIKMNHRKNDITVEYHWKRNRLFDKNACEAFLDVCVEKEIAHVEKIDKRNKSKWRPLPLDTVEFEKVSSRKLHINAKDAMKIAEKLYTQGLISYPRTETNIFPKELNLTNLVQQQIDDHRWGQFAQRIINEGGPNPRQGKKSDQAHPPIHPTKYINTLTGNDLKVYEYIVRHFLACVSKDAQGYETTIQVDMANEKFVAKGLMIFEKNYLDVFIYEKWNAKEVHNYQNGENFRPTELTMVESCTEAPKLLTEADLITLMEKYGIGTDATHAEHIDKIKSRQYVGLHESVYFVPGTLGMGLVEGYNNIGLEISLAKPHLRAEFENDLKLISDGLKDAETVRQEQIGKYRDVFKIVMDKIVEIDNSLATRLNDQPIQVLESEIINTAEFKRVMKCPKCDNDLILKTTKTRKVKYLSCSSFPLCGHSIWLPRAVEEVEILDEECEICGPNVKKLKIKFKQNLFPGQANPNVLCVGGCDENVLVTLDINPSSLRKSNLNPVMRNPIPTVQPNNQRVNQTINSSLRTNNIVNNSLSNNAFNSGSVINQTSSVTNSNFSSRPVSSQRPNNIGSHVVQSANILLPKPSGSGINRTVGNNNTNGSGDLQVVCHCGEGATLLTVRKEGPNTGRQFYKCTRGKDGGGCDFFSWADVDKNCTMNYTNAYLNMNPPNCNCNIPSSLRRVSKAGINKGRQFYCCSKPMGQGCNFFKWANEANEGGGNEDDDDNDGRGNGGGGGGSNILNTSATFRGASHWKRNTRSTTKGKTRNNLNEPYNKTKAKRKCGNCGVEGHTRNRCPNN